MKTLKKWIVFMLAVGLIVSAVKITAVTALASYGYTETNVSDFDLSRLESYNYSNGGYVVSSGENPSYYGLVPPTDAASGSMWMDMNNFPFSYDFDGTNWVSRHDGSIYSGPFAGSSGSSDGDSGNGGPSGADLLAIQTQAEARAVQHEASEEGFHDVGDMYRAAEKGMSAGEFYNNVVTSTPGIENAVTVGQGGNLVVNGVVTNMTASISKVTNRAYVDSVRISQPEGRLLNVVDVQYPAVEATINFYMPSVTADMEVVALQYSAGAWVNVDIVEVREDHVVLDMKGNGVVAFIAK